MEPLWGKSRSTGITLVEHTRHVIEAALALFGDAAKPTRLGECWLRFFKLDPETWPTLQANLIAACALHDWGKANDGMQAVLCQNGKQAIRHEHFSALLIGLPKVTAWLSRNPLLDVPVILSAVMTHHLKAAFEIDRAHGFAAQITADRVHFFQPAFVHADFRELGAKTRDWLGMKEPLPEDAFPSDERWVFGSKLKGFQIGHHRDSLKNGLLRKLEVDLKRNDDRSRLRARMLIAVRSALIVADACGSGLYRVGQPLGAWVEAAFDRREQLTEQSIREKVIDPRIGDLTDRGKWFDKGDGNEGWTDFQRDAANVEKMPDRTLLLAPCGSGKTLAAWRWIAARANEHKPSRVLFLYPTRATAKEGFKDYVGWAPEADAGLMHGTAAFDLRGMYDNEGDPRRKLSYEADRRLYAMGYWHKSIFSATVDQFLSFVQYGYGAVCMLPVLVDSLIVIDEVHSFDRNMFSALKRFLKAFRIPVLCMTATLPEDRRKQLLECGLTQAGEMTGELLDIAKMPRYRLRQVSRTEAEDEVARALEDGKRVLWVVNTVDRCHDVARKFVVGFDPTSPSTDLRTQEGKPVYVYHSRYRLSDRVSRHTEVVDRLKDGQTAALGITTQVCEMSLDLDVDLLVTEKCPVTSLIQRMGRCNRKREARPLTSSGEVLVYIPEKDAPYEPNDLKGFDEFIALVQNRELSQLDLEAAMNHERVPYPDWLGDKVAMFLESGAYAVSPRSDDEDANTFREGDDFNRQCVLLSQVENYNAASGEAKPGFIVPVPKYRVLDRIEYESAYEGLPPQMGVAADENYHPAVGFCGRPLDQWEASDGEKG